MTAQVGDILIYKAANYWIQDFPLENLFEQIPFKLPDERLVSSCWRGYKATWMVNNNQLILIAANPINNDDQTFFTEVIFKGKDYRFADWFTGQIKISRGEELEPFYDGGYESLYEEDEFLIFKNGYLVESRVVDNRKIDLTEYRKGLIDKQW